LRVRATFHHESTHKRNTRGKRDSVAVDVEKGEATCASRHTEIAISYKLAIPDTWAGSCTCPAGKGKRLSFTKTVTVQKPDLQSLHQQHQQQVLNSPVNRSNGIVNAPKRVDDVTGEKVRSLEGTVEDHDEQCSTTSTITKSSNSSSGNRNKPAGRKPRPDKKKNAQIRKLEPTVRQDADQLKDKPSDSRSSCEESDGPRAAAHVPRSCHSKSASCSSPRSTSSNVSSSEGSTRSTKSVRSNRSTKSGKSTKGANNTTSKSAARSPRSKQSQKCTRTSHCKQESHAIPPNSLLSRMVRWEPQARQQARECAELDKGKPLPG